MNPFISVAKFIFHWKQVDEIDSLTTNSGNRSRHWRCSVEKGILKNLADFTVKHLLRSLFYRVAGLKAYTLLKRDSNTGDSL